MFITFEGLAGSGKSTHLHAAAAWLRGRGVNVLTTREPGGTDIGEQIREVVLSGRNQAMQPPAEVLLFSAARAQLVAEVLNPHLAAGGVVLCDRFYDSTFAYQGYGHGLDLAVLQTLTRFATGGLVPDFTIYLRVSAHTSLRRRYAAALVGEEFDRLDAAKLEFHQRVYGGFEALAAAEPTRWVTIDAEQSIEAVGRDVLAALQARL